MTTTDLDRLLLIRHFERALLDLFAKGELNGTTHTCLGQEIVPVAVSGLLGPDDRVFSNHRGHGHYLARFDDPAGLLAEIMGREGAVCGGVGGSQHILRDGYVSTGVQGESLPVAAGAALHLRGSGALACAYIGDGTWGEGAVYESLNLAALWGLPLLVVVEHNGIAQTTPTELAMSGDIAARCAAFGVRHVALPADDVGAVRAVLEPLVSSVRTGSPLVVEFAVNRLGPHSKGDDTRSGVDELRDWYRDMSGDTGFAEADARAHDLVDSVVREVKARPASRWDR
ncbi:thiamine pyrophosphate-dependent dehydrogenase E1 component subunit alpha [Herbidospora cretacea]|uniref:thiamine pyrophosphate-dependent dehydrogenase E1 component subunit alpha n=1 Tax=Herbidospora cretacea TaxID=28444 RepID=UPI0007735211|nr:thiamine pyrophosphate-dependent dehydrogenase E1 component subunit alpha [Herbidospora cretacea]